MLFFTVNCSADHHVQFWERYMNIRNQPIYLCVYDLFILNHILYARPCKTFSIFKINRPCTIPARKIGDPKSKTRPNGGAANQNETETK